MRTHCMQSSGIPRRPPLKPRIVVLSSSSGETVLSLDTVVLTPTMPPGKSIYLRRQRERLLCVGGGPEEVGMNG